MAVQKAVRIRVLNSKHSSISKGSEGEVTGEHEGGWSAKFTVSNFVTHLPQEITAWIAKEEAEIIQDNDSNATN